MSLDYCFSQSINFDQLEKRGKWLLYNGWHFRQNACVFYDGHPPPPPPPPPPRQIVKNLTLLCYWEFNFNLSAGSITPFFIVLPISNQDFLFSEVRLF